MYQTIMRFLCIAAGLQVEPCGINGFDLFVLTGQISHREGFLSSVLKILKKTVLRGSLTLMDPSGESDRMPEEGTGEVFA